VTRRSPTDEAGHSAATANSDSDERTVLRRDKFAMVPESLITGEIAGAGRHQAGLVLAYAYLDLRQGDGKPAHNLTRMAEALGYQERTVAGWVDDLERAGLVAVVREGKRAVEVRVVHNPARGRQSAAAAVEVGTRSAPIKAGTRATHRGRRGTRPYPAEAATDARSSRDGTAALTREERASPTREERATDARRTRVEEPALPREERASAQVYKGLGVGSVEGLPREYSRDGAASSGAAGSEWVRLDRCTVCGGPPSWWTDDDEPRCDEHYPRRTLHVVTEDDAESDVL
jgi:hypothetical protein